MPPQKEKNRTLSIVSSNIRYDNPEDGSHSWPHRKRFLCERLCRLEADLLGTQEGRKKQIDELAERLPSLTLIDGHRHWDPELMYPCLFYDRKVLRLLQSGDIWLSRSPLKEGSRSFGSEFPRLCTWALFEPDLLAINVHLDSAQDSVIRQRQIRVLLEEIESLGMRVDHGLLMGDFNEPPDGMVRQEIMKAWPQLSDPWLELGLAEDSSHHQFGEDLEYGSRVDWIMAGPALTALDIYLDKTVSPEGTYASDHYILKARFEH